MTQNSAINIEVSIKLINGGNATMVVSYPNNLTLKIIDHTEKFLPQKGLFILYFYLFICLFITSLYHKFTLITTFINPPGICLTAEENPGKPQLGDHLITTIYWFVFVL